MTAIENLIAAAKEVREREKKVRELALAIATVNRGVQNERDLMLPIHRHDWRLIVRLAREIGGGK